MQPFERLEHEWAKFNDLDPDGMVACSSGTAALHLALEAFQLPPDSEVIVPDFTMVACPRAVAMAGLRPMFVDCDEKLLADPDSVSDAVYDAYDGVGNSKWKEGRLIKAAMMVNVYGRQYDVFNVRKATESWNIKIIEDMAEMHGVKPSYNADAACWSFYKNKIVAGEEGGAVWFCDPSHAKLARQLRSLGFTDAHDYNHVPRGHNYRMSDAHAAPILESIKRYETNARERRQIESWYDDACPVEWRQPARDAIWVYDFRIPNLCEPWAQDEIVRKLRANGIEARHGFKPMHAQGEFKGCRRVDGENAERASREVIYLPVNPGVTKREDAERAFDIVRSATART